MIKTVLLETWLTVSIFVWLLNGISLLILPQELWDWFNLVGIFVGTSINVGIAVNVYLNSINKIRWSNT